MNFNYFQKSMREKLMPTGDKLAELAQRKLMPSRKEIEVNFNKYLEDLLSLEFEIYKDYERKCSQKIIEEAIRKNLFQKGKTFTETFNKNYDNFWNLFLSISQSRMTRAGGSFEKHIRFLFNLLDYPFDTQTVLNGKVDYVIPSEKAFKLDRTQCVVISIKRTLRERWRQVIGELASTNAGRIYLLTIDEKLSIKKANEIGGHNIILVIPDKIKNSKFKDNFRIIGFTEFVKSHLPSSKKLWKPLLK